MTKLRQGQVFESASVSASVSASTFGPLHSSPGRLPFCPKSPESIFRALDSGDLGQNPTEVAGGDSGSCSGTGSASLHTLTSVPSLPAANVHAGEKTQHGKGAAEGERAGGGRGESVAVVSGDTVEVDALSTVCV